LKGERKVWEGQKEIWGKRYPRKTVLSRHWHVLETGKKGNQRLGECNFGRETLIEKERGGLKRDQGEGGEKERS